MSSTFELKTPESSVTIGRYAGPADDRNGSRRRYNITNAFGNVAQDLTRADLAVIARWIVRELETPHQE